MKNYQDINPQATKLFCFILFLAASFSILGQRRPSSILSPEVLMDNSVVFRVKAPEAKTVEVAGTWPQASLLP